MTFTVCNLGSKQPHLYSAYVVSVAFQSHATVVRIEEDLNSRDKL